MDYANVVTFLALSVSSKFIIFTLAQKSSDFQNLSK